MQRNVITTLSAYTLNYNAKKLTDLEFKAYMQTEIVCA